MFNKTLGHTIYMLFFLVPLVFTTLLYSPFIYTKQLTLEVSIILGAGIFIFYSLLNNAKLKVNKLDLLIFAYLIIIIINSLLLGSINQVSLILQLTVLYFLIYFYHQFNPEEDAQKSKYIIYFIAASAILVSLLALYEVFIIYINPFNKIFFKNGLRSTLGNPNSLAGYLAACIPFSILFYKFRKTKLSKTLRLAPIILISLAVIFTQSRGAWVAILAALIIFKYNWIKFLYKKARTNKILVVSVSLITIVLIALF